MLITDKDKLLEIYEEFKKHIPNHVKILDEGIIFSIGFYIKDPNKIEMWMSVYPTEKLKGKIWKRPEWNHIPSDFEKMVKMCINMSPEQLNMESISFFYENKEVFSSQFSKIVLDVVGILERWTKGYLITPFY